MKTQSRRNGCPIVRALLAALALALVHSFGLGPIAVAATGDRGTRDGQAHAENRDRDRAQSDDAADRPDGRGESRRGTGRGKGAASLRPGAIDDVVATPYETQTYYVQQDCPLGVADDGGDPRFCDNAWDLGFANPTSVRLELISRARPCPGDSFVVMWSANGSVNTWVSPTLGGGESTGIRQLGSGVQWISVVAIGHEGDCGGGELRDLEVEARVSTPRPPVLAP